MFTLRRLVRIGLILTTLATSPALAYECVQKGSELLQPRAISPLAIVRLSVRAEAETSWRPRTGIYLVDHAVHEWQEVRRFYSLAQRRRAEPGHR
jgi:hypothetical protein